ncbi:MAG: acyl-ACP--UDP-N-acetylglucosamine O-acyltransferase [Candidatus Omnitrophica bacterium]|nr:acyl-ACP--UDP-N-acetylglucosamine O-acyltransferase [Candidatus Omnitrophota bacterium]
MSTIHPSAMIHPRAVLGQNNEIGPHVIIEEQVTIGNDNRILQGAYIARGTTLGDHNQIHMHAVVGHEPQDVAYHGETSFTQIGSHNVIREFVTIHRGTKEGSVTVIGDHNFFMAYAHIAHNCNVGSHVILVNNASLTGYCEVEDSAFLSGFVGLHQFTKIGRFAMISALSAVNKDVPPYMMCGGRPAVVQGLNVVGLRRGGFTPEERDEIKRAYKVLYRSHLNVSQALEALERDFHSPAVARLSAFVKSSERGIASAQGEEEETLLSRKSSC